MATAPVSRSPASCSSAATTHCGNSATTPSRHRPSRRALVQVAQPRAARQAAALPAASLRQPTTGQMLWPLDPGFGCAVWQRSAGHAGPTNNDNDLPPTLRARQALTHTDAPRPAPEAPLPTRYSRGPPRAIERLKGVRQRDHLDHPSSPAPELTRGSWTEVSPGARAQRQIQHAHAPPENATTRDRPLTPDGRISKRSLVPRVPAHLLFANLETRRVARQPVRPGRSPLRRALA